MPYTPTVWNTGDTITATKINHLETQYAQALADSGSPGDVKASAASATPSGWLPCDGASLLRASYAALFSAIGTTFGAADGSHFNVPDLRGRVPVGAGTGSGLSARSLAQTAGQEKLPHNPTYRTGIDADNTPKWSVDGGATWNNLSGLGTPAGPTLSGGMEAADLNQTDSNFQPSLVLNYFIKT